MGPSLASVSHEEFKRITAIPCVLPGWQGRALRLASGQWDMKQSLSGAECQGRKSVPSVFLDVAMCISLPGLPESKNRLGGLNNKHLLPHSSGSLKSKFRSCQGWFLLRPLSLACRWWSSLHIFTRSLLWVCDPISFSYKDTSLIKAKFNDIVLPHLPI